MIITMSLPMTDPGNWGAEFEDAAKRGAKVRRIFLNYLDGECNNPNPYAPYLRIGTWNPGAIGGYPAYDHDVPMYDMNQISPDFITQLTLVAEKMKESGLIPWVVFDDRCSEIDGDWRQYNDPTYSNCQLHKWWDTNPPSTDRQYSGGNQALELNIYRENLESKVLEIFRNAGHTEIWGEPKNEYGYNEGEAYSIQDMLNWLWLRCDHLRYLGYRVACSIRPPITAEMVMEPGLIDLYDEHGIITPAEADTKMIENGQPYSLVIWNTDGSWSGDGPHSSCYNKYDMSESQGETLGAYAKSKGVPHVCYLCQSQIGWDHWNADNIDNRAVDGVKRGMEPEPPEPPDPPVETVIRAICEESRDLFNLYCPSIVEATFIKGEEPTTVCTIHKKKETIVDKIKEIWNWLFGPNSLWTKYPHLMGFLIGLVVGLLLPVIF